MKKSYEAPVLSIKNFKTIDNTNHILISANYGLTVREDTDLVIENMYGDLNS